jgi:hypothetical protein
VIDVSLWPLGEQPAASGARRHRACHRSSTLLAGPWGSVPDAGRSLATASGSSRTFASDVATQGAWRDGSASDSRSEGWEFESHCPCCLLAISHPILCRLPSLLPRKPHANIPDIAELAERLAVDSRNDQTVPGSIPGGRIWRGVATASARALSQCGCGACAVALDVRTLIKRRATVASRVEGMLLGQACGEAGIHKVGRAGGGYPARASTRPGGTLGKGPRRARISGRSGISASRCGAAYERRAKIRGRGSMSSTSSAQASTRS